MFLFIKTTITLNFDIYTPILSSIHNTKVENLMNISNEFESVFVPQRWLYA